MINLAARDVLHNWGRYLLTGVGLGLLIGITLTMAGVFRGMVDDATALIKSSGADIWVVQKNTLGPYAESSILRDDAYRGIAGLPGVAAVGNVTYLTMQIRHGSSDVRAMVSGFEPGHPGEPGMLVAGRPIVRSHYEAIADQQTGLHIGDRIIIKRNEFTVTGLTRRLVSSAGDPLVFIPLKDAQDAQFLKDSDAINNDRTRLAANPQLNRPGIPGLLQAVEDNQFSGHNVNAVLVKVLPGWDAAVVANEIKRWKHLQAYTLAEMEEILVAKLIATAARQIGLFLVILSLVSVALVALIIYTMTMNKSKEIAVLKLVGTSNWTISGMILQEAVGLGVLGFAFGKTAATLWAPVFPKYVLLQTQDAIVAFGLTLTICMLASLTGIYAALRVDPASAIGG